MKTHATFVYDGYDNDGNPADPKFKAVLITLTVSQRKISFEVSLSDQPNFFRGQDYSVNGMAMGDMRIDAIRRELATLTATGKVNASDVQFVGDAIWSIQNALWHVH